MKSKGNTFIFFDGTTRLREALAIVIHFVIDDWHDWLGFRFLLKELARELISILSIMYSISLDLLLATMRDQTSVNTTKDRQSGLS